MIQAKVVADSKNQFGNRLTTLEVVMPRINSAEFNTHRMLFVTLQVHELFLFLNYFEQ